MGKSVFVLAHIVFLDVCCINNGFARQKETIFQKFVFPVSKRKVTRRFFAFEMCVQSFQERIFFYGFLIRTAARLHFYLVHTVLHRFHVGHYQFKIDGFNIVNGVDFVVNMGDVAVFKATYNVHDCVYFTDVGKELIAQTFAARRAFYKTCDVYEFDYGRGNLFACVQSGKLVQAFIGNGYNAYVRFDGTERVVCTFCASVRDCIEKSGFPYVGKTYDTKFHIFLILFNVFLQKIPIYYNTKLKIWQIKLAQIKKIC